MKGSFIILGFFASGLLLGYFNLLPAWLLHKDGTMVALYILMFLVGVGIGADKRSIEIISSSSVRFLFVPLITIIGTYAGVSLLWLFLTGYNFLDLLAIGSGFGYYSLSSIYIAELRNESLGVIALLSNVMREIITLLFTPWMVKYFGKIAPICSGGATSMDTTLPIISKYSGNDYAIISLYHGTLLTILVPFLVSFLLSW